MEKPPTAHGSVLAHATKDLAHDHRTDWYKCDMEEPDFLMDPRSSLGARWSGERLGSAGPLTGRRRLGIVLIVTGWFSAAALAALAPFQAVFTIVIAGSPTRTIAGVDGWGRSPEPFLNAVTHGPRFGVALWVVAAGLVVLAAVYGGAMRRRPSSGLDPRTAASAIAIPCFLGGVFASLLLYAQSSAAQVVALSRGGQQFGTAWGWCMWFSLASLTLSIAATFLLLRSLRSSPG
jgi:hypothetical protein